LTVANIQGYEPVGNVCRILGKIGGVPALGPAMAGMLPKLPKGQVLKATASPAAREIHYSKAEDKDAV